MFNISCRLSLPNIISSVCFSFVTSTTASITSFAATGNSIVGGTSINVQSGGITTLASGGAVTTSYETSHTETVSGAVVESYGSLATTISGITGIKYGGDATHHYVGAFKEKIDGDTFVDAEGGKVDHVHPVSPSRTSGTDEVTGL